jgi:hypothetical protein
MRFARVGDPQIQYQSQKRRLVRHGYADKPGRIARNVDWSESPDRTDSGESHNKAIGLGLPAEQTGADRTICRLVRAAPSDAIAQRQVERSTFSFPEQ